MFKMYNYLVVLLLPFYCNNNHIIIKKITMIFVLFACDVLFVGFVPFLSDLMHWCSLLVECFCVVCFVNMYTVAFPSGLHVPTGGLVA
jgi:hypothetical protein